MRMQKEYRHLKSDISYKSPFGCFEIGFKCPGTAIPTVPGQGHLYYTIMGFASTVQEQNRVRARSEEHTSELQSRGHLVCRLLLEKKKTIHRERSTLQR